MKNVFISYSRDDYEVVHGSIIPEIERINGINCWLDMKDIEAGAKFEEKINDGLKECFIFLLMLSKSSMQKDWPLKELKEAEELKTQDPSRKIVLVNIDDSELTSKFEEYKDRDIISWNYTNQYQKLLRNIERWNNEKAESFYRAGQSLENSETIDDQKTAIELFEKSAEMGLAEAQSKMAYYYRVGKKDILEQDLEMAFKWGSKAYGQGFPGAAALMASLSKRMGDNAKFIKYHQEAAENGWKFSQYRLGESYYKGIIEGDIITAIYWLKKAADQNEPNAQELLGDILLKDFKEQKDLAIDYYNKAKKNFDRNKDLSRINKKISIVK